jgi:hypothetical protein
MGGFADAWLAQHDVATTTPRMRILAVRPLDETWR